jgi:UDPglucose 6-dehydrogenase
VRDLLAEHANVVVYDPKVPAEEIQSDVLGKGQTNARLTVAASAEEAAKDSHAIAIVTEWDEFKTLDYTKIFEGMHKPAFLFDGRNVVDLDALRAIGFRVHGIGR